MEALYVQLLTQISERVRKLVVLNKAAFLEYMADEAPITSLMIGKGRYSTLGFGYSYRFSTSTTIVIIIMNDLWISLDNIALHLRADRQSKNTFNQKEKKETPKSTFGRVFTTHNTKLHRDRNQEVILVKLRTALDRNYEATMRGNTLGILVIGLSR
jgi:hypothetical protein